MTRYEPITAYFLPTTKALAETESAAASAAKRKGLHCPPGRIWSSCLFR